MQLPFLRQYNCCQLDLQSPYRHLRHCHPCNLDCQVEALQELGQAEGQVQVQEQDYSERQPLLRCSNYYQCFQNCSYWRS